MRPSNDEDAIGINWDMSYIGRSWQKIRSENCKLLQLCIAFFAIVSCILFSCIRQFAVSLHKVFLENFTKNFYVGDFRKNSNECQFSAKQKSPLYVKYTFMNV